MRKNGTAFAICYKVASDTWVQNTGFSFIFMNGSTDYIDFQVLGYIDGGNFWNLGQIYYMGEFA